MAAINVAVAGSSGRMGRMLIEGVLADPDMRLAAALEQAGNIHVGRDAGELVGAPRARSRTLRLAAGST
jgi:4-hydroxy-tetrahydrodipicolinate reductase